MKNIIISLTVAVLLAGCASKILKYEKAEQLGEIKEFDQKVKIVVSEETPAAEQVAVTSTTIPRVQIEPAVSPTPTPAELKKKTKGQRRQPDIESGVGFVGRRPIKDPFRVGEKVVHEVTYLGMKAGTLTIEVRPFAMVNGRKSYNFRMAIASSSLFSSFYNIDDYVTTLVDYETLVPSVFTLHVKESAQLREARAYFDVKKGIADFWEKKVTEKHGEEEKKLQWEIPAYSQNVYSLVYYLRNFQWDVGQENAFRVADTGENLIFRGKAIRKEKISTEVGEFNAVVIKPEIELRGKFKPVGDIFLWVSDDDRKIILKIESKIKIGSLVSEIITYDPGHQ